MGFFLRRAALGPQKIIEIDEERYTLLANARKTLISAGAFEQRYELLLGNFTAFEVFCAETSVRRKLEFDGRYEKWAHVLSEANRHAINFLTTTRQYADSVSRGFSHLSLSESFADIAPRLLREAYGKSPEYRFVYELRNYVQHRAVAIHGIKSRKDEPSWTEGALFHCTKKSILEDQGKFKQKVLDETCDEVDILWVFRGYMAAVSRVQIELRKHVDSSCEQAREAIEQAMHDFSNAQAGDDEQPKSAIGLSAVKGEIGAFTDPVMLLLEWDNARIALAQKNIRPVTILKKP